MWDVSSVVASSRAASRLLRLSTVAFLLAGSALALAFGAIDMVIGALIIGSGTSPLRAAAVVLFVLAPPTVAALIPVARELQGVVVTTLLGVDLGGEPTPSRTRSQRLRTVAWFWLHLMSGAVAAGAVIAGTAVGLSTSVQTVKGSAGSRLYGLSFAELRGWPGDTRYLLIGIGMILVGVLIPMGCIRLLSALAPALLGPTPAERIAALDARTARLLERTRLARELHDSVGHALSVVVLQSAVAGRQARPDPEAAAAASDAAGEAARTALTELDDVLGLLREDAGPRQPARDLTALPELVKLADTSGQRITLQPDGDLVVIARELPAVLSREAYRIAQEGITNALKHAPGQPVTVAVERSRSALSLSISNPTNGGRPTHRERRRARRGVGGLAERVQLLGGDLHVGPASDDTWRVAVNIPVPRLDGGS